MASLTRRVGLTLLLSLAIFIVCTRFVYGEAESSDPCQFGPGEFNSTSEVRACFASIPLSESVRNETLFVMHKIFELYSFSDLVKVPFAPYYLQVNWESALQNFSTYNFTSDYDFHIAVAQMMNSLLDAHAIYFAPRGYRAFFTVRAFSLVSEMVNSTQQFIAAPANISPDLYMSLCNCQTDLNDFYNRQIVAVDDGSGNGLQPVLDYMRKLAPAGGLYIDPGVQLNDLVSKTSTFAIQPAAFAPLPGDSISILFNGDLVPYTFNNYMTTTVLINSSQSIIDYNQPISSLKRGQYTADDSQVEDEKDVVALLEEFVSAISSSRRDQPPSDHINDTGSKSSDGLSKDAVPAQILTSIQSLKRSIKLAELQSALSTNNKKRELHRLNNGPLNFPPAIRQQKITQAFSEYLKAKYPTVLKPQALERRKTLQQWQQQSIGTSSTKRNFDVGTTPASFSAGDPTSLYAYYNTPSIDYWSYEEFSVLKLKDFYPVSDNEIDSFMAMFDKIAKSRTKNGLADDLVIDVSGNGGGYICLAYFALSYLIRPWDQGLLTGNDILYNPYDLRISNMTTDLYNAGYFGALEQVSPMTRQFNPVWYTSPVEKLNGTYSQQFLWELCPSSVYASSKKSWVFDKLIIVTDGRCGSACSYFVSKLRASDKVRVLSYGGFSGETMDTSSFAGGNVESWTSFLDYLREHVSFEWMVDLPTSAVTSFNFREMFNFGDQTPRQFLRMPADWHLDYWEPLRYDMLDSNGPQVMANLYASTLPLFLKTPSGLPGTNPSSTTLTVVLAVLCSVIVVGVICATIAYCIITRRQKNGFQSL